MDQHQTTSLNYQKFRHYANTGGFQVRLDGKHQNFTHIGALILSHVCSHLGDIESFVNEILFSNDIKDFNMRVRRQNHSETDTTAWIQLKFPWQALDIIRLLDWKFFGANGYGKKLSCKPNGFTNANTVINYRYANYQHQEQAVREFNTRHYIAPTQTTLAYQPIRESNNDLRHRLNINNRRQLQISSDEEENSRVKRIKNEPLNATEHPLPFDNSSMVTTIVTPQFSSTATVNVTNNITINKTVSEIGTQVSPKKLTRTVSSNTVRSVANVPYHELDRNGRYKCFDCGKDLVTSEIENHPLVCEPSSSQCQLEYANF